MGNKSDTKTKQSPKTIYNQRFAMVSFEHLGTYETCSEPKTKLLELLRQNFMIYYITYLICESGEEKKANKYWKNVSSFLYKHSVCSKAQSMFTKFILTTFTMGDHWNISVFLFRFNEYSEFDSLFIYLLIWVSERRTKSPFWSYFYHHWPRSMFLMSDGSHNKPTKLNWPIKNLID